MCIEKEDKKTEKFSFRKKNILFIVVALALALALVLAYKPCEKTIIIPIKTYMLNKKLKLENSKYQFFLESSNMNNIYKARVGDKNFFITSDLDHIIVGREINILNSVEFDPNFPESKNDEIEQKQDKKNKLLIDEYRKRLRKRYNLENYDSLSDTASNKTNNKKEFEIGTRFIQDNGQIFNKVGFDKNGNKLNEAEKKDQVKELFKAIQKRGDKWSISYPSIGKEKNSIIVFSDPTCSVCRHFHHIIPDLNKDGISVRMMFYPRAMINGEKSINSKMVVENFKSAWCSKDPRESLMKLYNGEDIPNADCSILKEQNRESLPVKSHFLLGNILNIQGTPLIVAKNGDVINGFSNKQILLNKLNINK